MQERSGFVYIWRDRKHKRYYVGSHWGQENDGYICSSRWMRRSYNNRPLDFKRRILSRGITDRKQLYVVEQFWLNQIKVEERRVRYYNLTLSSKAPWYQDPERVLTIGEKISKKKLGKSNGPHSDITKAKMSAAKKGIPQSEEHKAKLSAAKTGTTLSEERKTQISHHLKEQYADGRRVAKKKERRPLYAPGERQRQLWADPVWAANQRARLKEGSAKRYACA